MANEQDLYQSVAQLQNIALQAYNQAAMSDMGKKTRALYAETRDMQLADVKEARKQQIEQAALNRKFMEEFYLKYSTPEAKMRLAREAGLNPYTVQGGDSFDAAAMGNIPYVDPSATNSAYENYASGVGGSLLSQQQMQSQSLSEAFGRAVDMAMQFKQVESLDQDVRAKKIQNDRDEFINRVWSSPISREWRGLLPGLDTVFDTNLYDSPDYGRNGDSGMSFGQALQFAQALEGLKNINEKGAGYYSNDPQNPWSKYLRSVATTFQRHGRDWSHIDTSDFSSEAFQPWKSAFDVVHGTNLSGISQSEYQRWYNDWSKELRKQGLNPEGNDLLNTALRVIHQTTPKDDFTYMMQSLGKGLGVAANGVGDVFTVIEKLLKPSEEYIKARDRYLKHRK